LSYTRKLAESGGLAPQPAAPVRLLSKQRPPLGGFTLRREIQSHLKSALPAMGQDQL